MVKGTTRILAVLALLLGAAWAHAQDWPQWRGPNRDNKVTGFKAPKTWPKELTQKWKVKVGEGDAPPVLVGDKIYAIGHQGSDEVITCLDAGTGKEVWSDKYAAPEARVPGNGHRGPRSSPAVADAKVCTMGVAGTLSCLDAATGKVAWRKETKGFPMFYTSSSPIIVDGKCIAQIGGGNGDVVAYDLASGEEKWKASASTAYGSPVLMTVDKTKMIVAPTTSSIVGINVADGKQLWKVSFSSRYNSATPIVDGQTVIYSAAGGGGGFGGGGRGGGGTVAYKVEKKDDGFEAKEVWKKSDGAGTYNTPVLKDGLLFGSTGGNRTPSNFFCMNAETGEMLWTDKTNRGEYSVILDAGDVLLGLTSDSQLLVFKPSKKGYEEVAKYKVADSPIWASPIVAGNRVFVKDRDSVILWVIE